MCQVVTRLLNTGTNQPLQTKEWYEDEDTTGRPSWLNTMKPHSINMGSPISLRVHAVANPIASNVPG